MKKLILLILIFLIVGFCFAQINPFRYGIEEEIVISGDKLENIRGEIQNILNNDTRYNGKTLAQMAKNGEITWEDAVRMAAEICFNEKERCKDYRGYIVTKVEIEGGTTKAIYITKSPLPSISPCEKGIGACLLFIFDKALRILYTASLAIGVIVLIWAGISYILIGGGEGVKKVHEKIKYGVLGLIVAILAYTIVIAIERGLTEELATIPKPSQEGTPSESKPLQPPPELTIYTPKVTQDGKLIFMYASDQANSCDFVYSVYDLTIGEPVVEVKSLTGNINMNMEGVQLNLEKRAGHTLRITFTPDGPFPCKITQKYVDVTVPMVIAVENPKIKIDNIKIDGTQWIRIVLPENITLEDIFKNIIIPGGQYYLYNPQFNIRIYYSTVEPAQKNGSCKIAAIIRGISVPNINPYNLSVITVKSFSKSYEFNLNYYKNQSNFVTTIPLDLGNNVIKGVNIEIFGYKGDCSVLDISPTNPIKMFVNIEAGKL